MYCTLLPRWSALVLEVDVSHRFKRKLIRSVVVTIAHLVLLLKSFIANVLKC